MQALIYSSIVARKCKVETQNHDTVYIEMRCELKATLILCTAMMLVTVGIIRRQYKLSSTPKLTRFKNRQTDRQTNKHTDMNDH